MADTFTWYNLELHAKMKDEFIKQMPEFDLDRCLDIANHGDIDEFRLLCNMLSTSSYDLKYFNDDYKSLSRLKKACNCRVNSIFGEDISELYNKVLHEQRHEEWAGDERYALFVYDIPKSIPRFVILSVVSILHYMNQPKSTKNAINIYHAFIIKLNSLYYERYEYDRNADPVIRNLDRMHHVDNWIKFTNYLWDRDYESAYSMIEEYNESLAI